MAPRTASIAFESLHHCLVNLPFSVNSALQQRNIAPQSLVVQLSYTSPPNAATPKKLQTYYVGWTGMASKVVGITNQIRDGAMGVDRIEMDPQFAEMLGAGSLVEGTMVSIELRQDMPVATSVSVTPLSPDDWEILETNAEFVETHLLNQVRAVKEGMVVGCWIHGRTVVRFLVDSVSPSTSTALRLSSDTELIVAPKTRQAPLPSTSKLQTHDLSSVPTTNGSSTSNHHATHNNPEWDQIKRNLVRLLPLKIKGGLDALGVPSAMQDEGTEEPIVWASSDLVRTFKAAALPQGMRCSISIWERPIHKSHSATNEGEDKEVKMSSLTSGNGVAGAEKEKEKERIKVQVRVREARGLESGHVWVGEKVRTELGMGATGVEDVQGGGGFELIRFSYPVGPLKKAEALESSASKLASPPLTNGAMISSPHAPTSISVPLAGVEDKLEAIRSHVINALAGKRLGGAAGRNSATSGVLVTGASGAGKTAVVKQVAKELQIDPRSFTHTLYVDCAKLADERLFVLKGKIRDWFDEACWHAPTLLVLDNLDRILGAEVEHADSFPSLHLAQTFLSAALAALDSRLIIILATSQSSASLHPLLCSTHLLGETISLRGPGKNGRRDILSALVRSKADSSNLVVSPQTNYATIATLTEGYLPADLRDLVDRGIQQAAIRSSASPTGDLTLIPADFTTAQVNFLPLSLRDIKLQKSSVQWADIGGLHDTRRVLRETLEWPTKYGAIFAGCPLRLRSGLLLYGFPGCGKTLLASAVAKECGLNFISVKGPEILNKYIGASEKSVRDLFERAQAAKPCILFFDEFDSIAPKRGHDSTGVTDRVVNQMLTQMDGAEGLDGVYVLAATSRPDLIDPALLRPGRLDKSLLCDMPSYQDRLEILQACSRKIELSPAVDLAYYATQTAGFSGADLQALVYNAHLDAIHAKLTAETTGNVEESKSNDSPDLTYKLGGGADAGEKVLSRAEQAAVSKRLELIMSTLTANSSAKSSKLQVMTPSTRSVTYVEESHLEKSLKSTRPSVPAEELFRLNKIYSEFVSGRSATGLPSGEASDAVGGRSSLM